MSGFRSLLSLAVAIQSATTFAGTVLSVDFASGYTNGNLVGQNNWTQTGATTTNPIQVTSGSAIVGTTGQDVYKAFAQAEPLVAGNYVLTRIDFFPTAAQATGDYFFHVSDPAGSSSNFYQRLYAKSVSGSIQYGLGANGGGTYGTTAFLLNQATTAVMKWNVISGTSNDTIDLFINPADPANPSGSPYVSVTWAVTEPSSLAAVNFRQGSTGNAPSLRVSSLQIEAVPEPGTIGLLGLTFGGIGILAMRRRRVA